MAPPYLLHTAPTGTTTTVDLRVVVAAAVAFGVSLARILRPAWLSLRAFTRRRTLRRMAHAALAVLVFLAVLPCVLPCDHLFAHGHAPAADEIHASHCHLTPGSCSDAPVTSGPGQLLLTDPVMPVPNLLMVPGAAAVQTLRGIVPEPDLRPPLA